MFTNDLEDIVARCTVIEFACCHASTCNSPRQRFPDGAPLLGWAAPPIGGLGCFRESTARRIY
jgi:hypothetical protein